LLSNLDIFVKNQEIIKIFDSYKCKTPCLQGALLKKTLFGLTKIYCGTSVYLITFSAAKSKKKNTITRIKIRKCGSILTKNLFFNFITIFLIMLITQEDFIKLLIKMTIRLNGLRFIKIIFYI